ncbi:hypothetical protein LINPERPRIM_LOCUS24402, partial [Linum perenne]
MFSYGDHLTFSCGDINFLVTHFLDMLDLPEELCPDVRPTCSFWDDGRVKKAVAHIRRGKSG